MEETQLRDTAAQVACGRLGQEIRRLRLAAKLTQHNLAERVHYSRSYVAVIETGREKPSSEAIERISAALGDDGLLHDLYLKVVNAHQSESMYRASDSSAPVVHARGRYSAPLGCSPASIPDEPSVGVGAMISGSSDDSIGFLSELGSTSLGALAVEQLHADVERLSVDYLNSPPQNALWSTMSLRRQVYRALVASRHPTELRALHVAHGRLSGVLAYVALDLDDGYTAMAHTRAALLSAQVVGDQALAAWVRGTQSLIARFQGRFRDALAFARAGQALQAGGTSSVRLWCAEAQCLAQLGDARGTLLALNAARDAIHEAEGRTLEYGVFAFPSWKLSYYAGGSLIWLTERQHAKAAIVELATAIDQMEAERSDVHSSVDHVLARIYQSTAHLLARDLDAARATVKTVLNTPSDLAVSWHARRLGRVHGLLMADSYRNSPIAQSLAMEISDFASVSLKSLNDLPKDPV